MKPKIGTKQPNRITEEYLHRFKVIARKRQIEMIKLENEEYPFQPYNIMQYTTPKRQIHFLKVVWEYIKYGLLLLKELRP